MSCSMSKTFYIESEGEHKRLQAWNDLSCPEPLMAWAEGGSIREEAKRPLEPGTPTPGIT